MFLVTGDYFFHYTTRDAAFEHIIPTGKLRLSPYSKMHDPLESKGSYFGAVPAIPNDPAAEAEMRRSSFDRLRELARLRAQTKLLSLTINEAGRGEDYLDNFGRGWARARMWEHYSENHHGVCLAFERDRFESVALEQLRARSSRSRSGPVRYTKGGLADPKASRATLIREAGKSRQPSARDHLATFAEELLYVKVLDWESEHEYRFTEPSDDDEYSFVDFADTLLCVIVGHEFPRWQLSAVHALCSKHRLDLREVRWEYFNRPMLRNVEIDHGDRDTASELESNEPRGRSSTSQRSSGT